VNEKSKSNGNFSNNYHFKIKELPTNNQNNKRDVKGSKIKSSEDCGKELKYSR